MEKHKLKVCLKEFGAASLQFFFSRINLFGFFSPVGLAFAFSRLFSGGNIFVTVFAYFISKLYLFGDISGVAITIYEVVLLSLYYFAMEFIKTKRKFLLLYFFLIISNCLELYFNISNLTLLWHFAVNFLAELIILFYFCKLFAIYRKKFIFFKFSYTDYIFFSVVTLFLSIGIFTYSLILEYFGLFLIAFLLVLLCKVLPLDKYLIFISAFCLGCVIASSDYFYLVFSTISCVLFFQIKELNKYLYSALCFVLYGIFLLVFRLYEVCQIIQLSLSILAYIILPNKFVSKIKSLFDLESDDILKKCVEEKRLQMIEDKLFLMSNALLDMHNNFKFMLIGKIDRQKACEALSEDVLNKCCSNCECFNTCFLNFIDKKNLISGLLFKAVQNGKVDEQDITNGTACYCSKSGLILNEVNQMAGLFLSYEKSMKAEDESKLMISNEILNFSYIFRNFAKIVQKSSKINEKWSKILKNALFGQMIDAKEVAILEDEKGISSVRLALTNEQALKREVPETIFKITKVKMKMLETKHTECSGVCVTTFVPVSKMRAEFAVSTKSKEAKNGDNYVISKFDENRYFVAICDGMGHGKKANKLSSMVLSLVKSFFEVGLEENLIISSINKLLLPIGLDGFTTLDCAVIDLGQNICSFVKLGSSVSIIKHYNTSEVISSESLPIGIVWNIKPTIITKQISAGDIIFLASDGIVDSFQNIDIYKSFVNDAKIYNLQKYLDEIVFDAEHQNQEHPDDMTIIGVNLLKN